MAAPSIDSQRRAEELTDDSKYSHWIRKTKTTHTSTLAKKQEDRQCSSSAKKGLQPGITLIRNIHLIIITYIFQGGTLFRSPY